VLGGRIEHALKQLLVARLELLALPQSRASPANPLGQRIPHPLELIEPGDPRLAEATGDLSVNVKPRKRLGAKSGKLMLQPTDLPPKLNARKPLIASNAKRGKRLVFKQFRHEPGPSVDHQPGAESDDRVKERLGRGGASCTFSS